MNNLKGKYVQTEQVDLVIPLTRQVLSIHTVYYEVMCILELRLRYPSQENSFVVH